MARKIPFEFKLTNVGVVIFLKMVAFFVQVVKSYGLNVFAFNAKIVCLGNKLVVVS